MGGGGVGGGIGTWRLLSWSRKVDGNGGRREEGGRKKEKTDNNGNRGKDEIKRNARDGKSKSRYANRNSDARYLSSVNWTKHNH